MKLKVSVFAVLAIIAFSFPQKSNAQSAADRAVSEAKQCMDDRLRMIKAVPGVAYSTTTFASDLVFEECLGSNTTSLMSTRSSSGLEMISKIRVLLLAAWVKKYPKANIDPAVKGKVDEFLKQVKPDSYSFNLYTRESDETIRRELALIRPVLASSQPGIRPANK